MTQIASEFSLTDYVDHRKLEFQYLRVKYQNEQLSARLEQLQALYVRTVAQLKSKDEEVTALRSEELAMSEERKEREKEREKMGALLLGVVHRVREPGFGEGRQAEAIGAERGYEQVLGYLEGSILGLAEANRQLESKMRKIQIQTEEREKSWSAREESFSAEIAELQLDLQSLEKLQQQVQEENQKMLKQSQELRSQVKSYKIIAMQARAQHSPAKALTEPSQFVEQDKDFANDLLSYQKQLLCRVYGLVTESMHDSDMQIGMRKILEAYEEVIECYREKLQIQYDLSDLQCQYQKQKGTGAKNLLIQLRSEINCFRKQLLTYKDKLQRSQQILEQRIEFLSGQSIQDHRLKNFTIDLQMKLRKHTTGATGAINSNQAQSNLSTIEFKPSKQADSVVQKLIQKDRLNMEKMLRQTRRPLIR